MAPLMPPAGARLNPLAELALDAARPLLLGVLPHPFCNPKVKGCGFCTFPHEKFGREPMRRVLACVAREIEQSARRYPALRRRNVEAIYIGGGTANLTPPDDLEHLLGLVAANYAVAGSELTLEGVPAYFLLREEALLDVVARAPVRHRRISMGVQTFDDTWLKRMGRDAFGDRRTFQRVIDAAHRRGFTISADLLFNLPGTSRAHSLADVRAAMECGLDQICIYNLVLTESLDTEWAHDRSLVRLMPRGAEAKATWEALRETLCEGGYVQTTLTNFERADVAASPRRFEYERASFDPGQYDGIGFGPGAISTFTSVSRDRAVKWVNEGTSEVYAGAVENGIEPMASRFDYGAIDLRLLHVTRNLSRLAIDTAAYERFFGTTLAADFAEPLEALEVAGLVQQTATSADLTPEGMFYADAVAGLFSHRRVASLGRHIDDRSAVRQFMG